MFGFKTPKIIIITFYNIKISNIVLKFPKSLTKFQSWELCMEVDGNSSKITFFSHFFLKHLKASAGDFGYTF